MFRRSINVCLSLIVVLPLFCTKATLAADSFWEASTVDWWVAEGSEDSSRCQIHWLFDEKIDVSFQRSAKGYFYFSIEDQSSEIIKKSSQDNEAYLVISEKEVPLTLEKVTRNSYVAPLPQTLSKLDIMGDSDLLLLSMGSNLYHLPLENSSENFSVYKDCARGNDELHVAEVKSEPIKIDPVVQTLVEPQEMKVDVSPSMDQPSDDGLRSVVSDNESASIEPIDLEPVAVPNQSINETLIPPRVSALDASNDNSFDALAPVQERVAQAEEKAGEVSKSSDDAQDMASLLSEDKPLASDNNDSRVSKTPVIDPMKDAASIMFEAQSHYDRPSAAFDGNESDKKVDDMSVSAYVEPQNPSLNISPNADENSDLEVVVDETLNSAIPQEIPEKQPVDENSVVDQVLPEEDVDAENQDVVPSFPVEKLQPITNPDVKQVDSVQATLNETQKVTDVLKKADSKQGLDGCPEPSSGYGAKTSLIINNLTRKLSVLEKEKENLRKKLLTVNDSSVISEIVACNTQPELSAQQSLNEEMVEEFENIIDNLRAENDLLNAAILDGEETAAKEVSTSAVLNEQVKELQTQINNLKLVNADLSREIAEYQELIENSENEQEEVIDSIIESDPEGDFLTEDLYDIDLDEDIPSLDINPAPAVSDSE